MTYSNYYLERDIYYAASYLRISKEDGDKIESDSIESQRSIIKQYISKKQNIKTIDEYVDDGYTGTNFNRPGFKRMMEDIKSGLVNCVIVKDLSRFGRDYIGVGNYLERYFPDKDIRFIAINDNVDNYDSGYDDMYMPVKNLFNAQYPKDISKKVQSSFKAKQSDGDFIGAFASYGYHKSPHDKHKLIIDEYASIIVKRIFDMYANGVGKIRIAKILNEENVLCPSEYKKSIGLNYTNCNKMETTHYWTYATINNILKNEMYIGNMVQSKTVRRMHGKPKKLPKEKWIIVKGTHEPIISKEQWETVQVLLSKNTMQLDFQKNVSVFAGFLKCADCGRAMCKTTWRRDGIAKTYYSCGSYKRYGSKVCTSHHVSEHTIMCSLLNVMNDSISKIKNIRSIWDSVKKSKSVNFNTVNAQIQNLSIEIEKLKKKKLSLYDDFKDELISKEEYLELRQKYQSKEIQLNNQISILTKKTDSESDLEKLPPMIEKLLNYEKICEQDIDRDFMATFVKSINIHENNEIELNLNFCLPDISAI